MTTGILLVDHHQMFLDALRAIITKREDLSIVGEATDGQQALAMGRDLRPDLILLEIPLPRLSGIEVTRRLTREGGPSKVLIVSMHEGRSHVEQALRAGASGFVVKSGSSDELLKAIDSIRSGKGYLSPAVSQHLVDSVTANGNRARSSEFELTSREREVLQLVGEGLSTKEIAESLSVSTRTIETHRAKLMEKLGIHKVSGLVRYAIREGLILP